MDASPVEARLPWQSESHSVERVSRSLTTSLVALLGLASVLFCARRASGALSETLPALALLSVSALVAATALVFRRVHGDVASGRLRLAGWAAPSVVYLLLAGALTIQGTSPAGLLALWGLLVAEECWSWRQYWLTSSKPRQTSAPYTVDLDRTIPITAIHDAAVGQLEAGNGQFDIAVTQQLVRRRSDAGTEQLQGWLRADFAAGQRHANAHLAICPPLDRVPECFAEQMDGPPAEIKVGQVLPHGVRFEIKLDDAAEDATSVVVEFLLEEHRH